MEQEFKIKKYGNSEERLQSLANLTGVSLNEISKHSLPDERVIKNIENYIGMAKIPIGIVGPLQVNGKYANGMYYVPFATTEGTLVETYTYGSKILNFVGGVNVELINDQLDITPVFLLSSQKEATKFIEWIKINYDTLKCVAETTTKYGKLKEIIPEQVGFRAFLTFVFTTGDAMGLNIVNIATSECCKYIIAQYTEKITYFLRCNYSSDKKPSASNLMKCYGKKLIAEAIIPKKYITRFFKTTPEQIFNFYYSAVIGSTLAGMIGFNGHFANALASIYIACGQDVAQIVNACIGILNIEIKNSDDLYISIKTPNIVTGTVGGGTSLPTQNECLQIMGCAGTGNAKKFAEIITSILLAGELTLCAALSANTFIDAHVKKRNLGLEKILQN